MLVSLLLLVVIFIVTQPLFPWSVSAKSSLEVASRENLITHGDVISNQFKQRDILHPENLFNVAKYIKSQFERFPGYQVQLQTYQLPTQKSDTVANVRAVLSTANGRAPRIVVGAHYDSASGYAAADDNASGVAGLIELARIFAERKKSLEIEFVAYTLEEPPAFRTDFMGSNQHVLALLDEGVTVKAMLSLEMLGYYCTTENCQNYPNPALNYLYPRQGDFIAVVGNL